MEHKDHKQKGTFDQITKIIQRKDEMVKKLKSTGGKIIDIRILVVIINEIKTEFRYNSDLGYYFKDNGMTFILEDETIDNEYKTLDEFYKHCLKDDEKQENKEIYEIAVAEYIIKIVLETIAEREDIKKFELRSF